MKKLLTVALAVAALAGLLMAGVDDDMWTASKQGQLTRVSVNGSLTGATNTAWFLLRTIQSKRLTLYPIVTSSGCIVQIVGPMLARTNGTLAASSIGSSLKLWLYRAPIGLTNLTRTNLNILLPSGAIGVFPTLPLSISGTVTNSYLLKLRNAGAVTNLYNLNLNIW